MKQSAATGPGLQFQGGVTIIELQVYTGVGMTQGQGIALRDPGAFTDAAIPPLRDGVNLPGFSLSFPPTTLPLRPQARNMAGSVVA